MSREVIKLNLIPKGDMPVFHASQFDTGRLITCELYNGEDAYNVPSGYTIELHCRKVDNNIVTMASTTIDDNVVKFTSTEQLTACNGKNLCEVAILDDGYRIGTLNFWLEVEVDPLKGGITSTSEIHDLYEQVEEITTEVIGDDYYNKTQVDDLLDTKADKSTTYTKTQVDTLLTSKADKSNTYTKSETDTLLSAKADSDDVYTKGQVETKLAAKADAADVYTKDETDTLLDAKANANGVYSKLEVDAMVDDLEDAIDLKADQSTTYTKTEVNTALALKANAADVYTKSQVDTALALKANAADVYTKAETDAKIEEAIEEILPVDTAGPSAIASFTTGLALPLVNCTVGITATGGNGTPETPNPINGYTEAKITRCGVNLFNGVFEIGHRWDGDGTYVTQSDKNAGTPDKIPCKPNTTYAFIMNNISQITYMYLSEFDANKTHIQKGSGTQITTGTKYVTFTTGANTHYVAFSLYSNTDFTSTEVSDIGMNYPSTDTTYHAYTGNTYTIAFGQTVYGGVLDVTRGKLTVKKAIVDIGDIAWTYYAPYKLFIHNMDGMKSGPNKDLLCSCFESSNTWPSEPDYDDYDNVILRAGNDSNLRIKCTDYTDGAMFQTAMAGQKIVYELATPFDIDLTPEVISAVVGTNNVYSDTNGDTTVKFKDTIQNYIDKKVST